MEVRDDLYFTYLHDLKDTDYLSMGLGRDLASETRDSEASNKDLEIR